MPQTGYCADVTCNKELTELYECHCCSWLVCLKHLLEHVDVTKREKQAQLDGLRNELLSISSTLEVIVEKKNQEIEREQRLINQAKTLMDKSEHTMEEIQLIAREINQAIVSNRKEETIVKVESSLLGIKTCSCTNEISYETINDRPDMSNLYLSSSASNNILQQPKSPVYRTLRSQRIGSEVSSTPKNNDHSTKVGNGFDISNVNDINIDPTKDEADGNEEHDQENITNHNSLYEQCPLTFDGAFGLTKAKHSIELCPLDKSRRRHLLTHFMHKHNIKKTYAYRLHQAVKYGQNSETTNLFNENEDVIDHDRHRNILCPFNSTMINLIGHCPTQSRKIPCPCKAVPDCRLMYHLKQYHHLSHSKAKEITKSYKEKISKVALFGW